MTAIASKMKMHRHVLRRRMTECSYIDPREALVLCMLRNAADLAAELAITMSQGFEREPASL